MWAPGRCVEPLGWGWPAEPPLWAVQGQGGRPGDSGISNTDGTTWLSEARESLPENLHVCLEISMG